MKVATTMTAHSATMREFKVTSVTHCCDANKDAWSEGFIGFGDIGFARIIVNAVCIYKCTPYPEGAVFDYVPVSFCPFCGKRIEVG